MSRSHSKFLSTMAIALKRLQAPTSPTATGYCGTSSKNRPKKSPSPPTTQQPIRNYSSYCIFTRHKLPCASCALVALLMRSAVVPPARLLPSPHHPCAFITCPVFQSTPVRKTTRSMRAPSTTYNANLHHEQNDDDVRFAQTDAHRPPQ